VFVIINKQCKPIVVKNYGGTIIELIPYKALEVGSFPTFFMKVEEAKHLINIRGGSKEFKIVSYEDYQQLQKILKS